MNSSHVVTDQQIRAAFERRARRVAADGLHTSIFEATRTVPQHRGPLRLLRGIRSPASARAMVAATVLIALLGIAAALVGALIPRPAEPQPRPGFADLFLRPFDYAIPAGSQLSVTLAAETMYAFTEGSEEIYGVIGVDNRARGVTVTALVRPNTHSCPITQSEGSRQAISNDPATFLDDLRRLGGIAIAPETPGSLDGRAAVVAVVDPAGAVCETTDFHTDFQFVSLAYPSVLVVTQVDQTTVVVQTWASSEAGLETWLLTAMQFVDSIRFGE